LQDKKRSGQPKKFEDAEHCWMKIQLERSKN